MVTGKPTFREVLAYFEEFMQKNFNVWPSLSSSSSPSPPSPSFTFVTCGDWDLKTMFPRQLSVSGHPDSFKYPVYFESWINLKRVFGPFLGLGTKQFCNDCCDFVFWLFYSCLISFFSHFLLFPPDEAWTACSNTSKSLS